MLGLPTAGVRRTSKKMVSHAGGLFLGKIKKVASKGSSRVEVHGIWGGEKDV
jgi:hypothetical protein